MTRKNNGKSKNKNELLDDNIRLIKSKDEWKQFIEMTRENFPEFIDKVLEEGIEYHHQEERYLFGKFNESDLIGTIGLQISKLQNLAIIGYLQVKKEFRKQGIAKKLYKKIANIAKKEMCNYHYLAVLSRNNDAIAMYKHWGFKRTAMIYNIAFSGKIGLLNKKKLKSARYFITKEKEIDNLVDNMFTEFYLFNKIYHYFEELYHQYTENNVYSRRIRKKNHLTVINILKNNEELFFIFLLRQSKENLEVVKEELLEIRNTKKNCERKITIFGRLSREEITEIEKDGIEFESPFNYQGYMLEL